MIRFIFNCGINPLKHENISNTWNPDPDVIDGDEIPPGSSIPGAGHIVSAPPGPIGDIVSGIFFIAQPTLPFSITYSLDITPGSLTAPFDFISFLEYRSLSSGALFAPQVTTTLLPVTYDTARTVNGLCATDTYADDTTLTVDGSYNGVKQGN